MYGPARLCDVRYYGVMCGNARQDQVRNMKQDMAYANNVDV